MMSSTNHAGSSSWPNYNNNLVNNNSLVNRRPHSTQDFTPSTPSVSNVSKFSPVQTKGNRLSSLVTGLGIISGLTTLSMLMSYGYKSNHLSSPNLTPVENSPNLRSGNAKLHVMVYETGKPAVDQSSKDFISKAEHLPGFVVHRIGQGVQHQGFGTKWPLVRMVLDNMSVENMPDDTIIVISDNRDVVPNMMKGSSSTQPVQEFLNKFQHLTKGLSGAVVVSAEEGCCVGALTYIKPGDLFNRTTGERTMRACPSGEEGCTWNGEEKLQPWTSFMSVIGRSRTENPDLKNFNLNMGLVAGTKKDILKLIDQLDLGPSEDDQAVATDYFFNFPNLVVLDYNSELFGNNKWYEGMDGCLYTKEGDASKLVHRDTGAAPLFLHTSGLGSNPKFTECLDRFSHDLGYSDHSAKNPLN